MKTSKKIISLLLVAVLMLGLGVSAFAATEENVKQYKTYLCLGDSISAGCGVPFKDVNLDGYDASLKYWGVMYHGYNFEAVPRAYHSLVAEAVGAKLIQGGVSGNRSVEMRYLLDGTYNDCDKNGYWGMVFFGSNGTVKDTCAKLDACDKQLKAKYGVTFKNAVKKADLITVNLGSNDVLSYSAMLTMASLSAEHEDDSMLSGLIDKIMETGDVLGVFSKFLELANTAGKLAEVLNTLTTSLVKSSTTYKTNLKNIVKDIYALNPDTTVVAVGIYNPFNQFKLSDSVNIQVGKIMDPVVADLNLFLKSLERSYTGYKYADCSKTEIYEFNLDNVSSGDYITKVHPTLEGHKYMTKQILSVLPEKEETPEQPAEKTLPFTDVKKNHWAYDAIQYVYDNGIMIGTSSTKFSPDKFMTRAEFATVLYRIADANAKGLKEPFKDVDKNHWAYDAIRWAYNNGIVKGYSDDKFAPDEYISRAQMVTMLYRYDGSPKVSGDLSMFKDGNSVAAAYKNAVIWAAQNKIVVGNPDGCFAPNDYTTRAHMAAVIQRYLTK